MKKKTKDVSGYTTSEVKEFLEESNAIEGVYSKEALEDAGSSWNYLKRQRVLSPSIILDVHKLIMQRVDPRIAGKWRDCDVWIGGHPKHFVSVQLIEEDIKNFLVNMGVSSDLPKEDLDRFVKNCHIAFEGIHPFRDGNGRTGRLIYLWHRMKLGLPIHIIHADWPKKDGEQAEYYSWFR